MTRQIRRLSAVLLVMLTALLINVSVIQVWLAPGYRNASGNQRVLLEEYSRERGPILLGNTPIARSIPTNDQLKYLRKYSSGELFASATGFYSLVYGATGIERTENSVLSGSDDRFFVDRLQQLFAGRQPRGGAVQLTLNPKAQKAAFDGLAGRTGAVVAINPTTGAILALVSSPSFDPNRLSSHDPADIRSYYDTLTADPAKPLQNRPLAMTLPPGSAFKLVTTAAALENGYTPSSVIPGPASLKLPNSSRELRNWTGKGCGPGDKTTLANALAVSCNTAFAWLGIKLGADVLRSKAEEFGFNDSFAVPLRAAISRFPPGLDPAQTAMAAIGQFDVTATALQMAMVGAGAANNGMVMSPYLVQEVLGPDLAVLETATPARYNTALSPENAAALVKMMVGVVENGTGSNAQIPGVAVGGKTGTAQTAPGRPPHAWFVGIAPAISSQVAVAVVLENGGGAAEISGNRLAAPIARAVMAAVLAP